MMKKHEGNCLSQDLIYFENTLTFNPGLYHNYINSNTLLWHNGHETIVFNKTLGAALNVANCRTVQPTHLCNLLGNLANAGSINYGFNTSHSAHDIISKLSEMTALQRFSSEVNGHLLGRTPMEADFLHVHPQQ
jgi:hypothetical protein